MPERPPQSQQRLYKIKVPADDVLSPGRYFKVGNLEFHCVDGYVYTAAGSLSEAAGLLQAAISVEEVGWFIKRENF